jgi:hypothetical protein
LINLEQSNRTKPGYGALINLDKKRKKKKEKRKKKIDMSSRYGALTFETRI